MYGAAIFDFDEDITGQAGDEAGEVDEADDDLKYLGVDLGTDRCLWGDAVKEITESKAQRFVAGFGET